eukprot:scaffold107806_cov38-Tisochrysis_lutea.AAC.2
MGLCTLTLDSTRQGGGVAISIGIGLTYGCCRRMPLISFHNPTADSIREVIGKDGAAGKAAAHAPVRVIDPKGGNCPESTKRKVFAHQMRMHLTALDAIALVASHSTFSSVKSLHLGYLRCCQAEASITRVLQSVQRGRVLARQRTRDVREGHRDPWHKHWARIIID